MIDAAEWTDLVGQPGTWRSYRQSSLRPTLHLCRGADGVGNVLAPIGRVVWKPLRIILWPVGRFFRKQLAEMGKLLMGVGAGAMLAWWGAVSASASSSHPLHYEGGCPRIY